jgi:hypothetical protein
MKKIKGIKIQNQFIGYASSQEFLRHSAGVGLGGIKV